MQEQFEYNVNDTIVKWKIFSFYFTRITDTGKNSEEVQLQPRVRKLFSYSGGPKRFRGIFQIPNTSVFVLTRDAFVADGCYDAVALDTGVRPVTERERGNTWLRAFSFPTSTASLPLSERV